MYKKTGTAALVAAVSLTGLAACSATTTGSTSAGGGTSTGSTTTGSGGSGTGSTNLTPASALLAALTKSSGDNSVTVNGTVSGGAAGTTKLSGVEEFQPLKSSMTISMTGGSAGANNVSAIFDGTNYFIKDSQLSAIAGGKTWLELSTSALGTGANNPLGSMVDSLKMQSPTSELGALVASGDLTDVGSDNVDGQQATHYHGTLTAAQAADVAAGNGLDATEVQEIKSLFADGGITSETMDVWVANGLPVRVTTTESSTTLGSTTSTFDFTGWGAPVTITDPPSDQVGAFNIPGLPTGN